MITKIKLCLLYIGVALTVFDARSLAKDLGLARTEPVPANEQIPTADFFRQSMLEWPSVNDAGTHVAALITGDEDKSSLLVFEIATQKLEYFGGDGSLDINWFSWLDSSHLMFQVSTRKLFGLGYMVGQVSALGSSYPVLQNTAAQLLAVPHTDRMNPIFWIRRQPDDDGGVREAGVASVKTAVIGERAFYNLVAASATHSDFSRVVENNRLHLNSIIDSPSGKGQVVGHALDIDYKPEFSFTMDRAGTVTMFREENDKWIGCPFDFDKVEHITRGDARGDVIFLGPRDQGKPRAAELYDAATGKLKGTVVADKNYDFDGYFIRDAKTRTAVGAAYTREGPALVWFDDGYRMIQQALDKMFPGLVVRIVNSDQQRKVFVVATSSDRQPTIYHFFDMASRQVGLLKSSRPWIDPKRMQPMNVLKYKTRDGKQLDAYLTLPKGASKDHPAPLVVMPHGGPFARDS